MSKSWYYFGCHQQAGHYLFDERMWNAHDALARRLANFDGSLCYPESEGLYRAAVTRLGGAGYTALAFWDRTVDKRPASNSVFFAPGLLFRPDLLLAQSRQRFPRVFARLPDIDIATAMAEHDAFLRAYGLQRAGE